MKSFVLLLLTFLMLRAAALTQTTGHAHSAPADIIDGSKTPNLIHDSTAWRLWLIAVTSEDTKHPELTESRRRAFLKQAGVPDEEMQVALETLAKFKSEYATLISNHNRQLDAGESPALSDFVAQRATGSSKTFKQLYWAS